MAIIHLFDLWLMYALVRVADLLILIYSHFDLFFFLGIFFVLLLLLFPSHQRFFFSPQEFISNLDRHSDTMFALICTLFMRKFRCQIIIVGPMTCTSVLCVCCACVWMLFFLVCVCRSSVIQCKQYLLWCTVTPYATGEY